MYGLPEVGKTGKAIDAALDHINAQAEHYRKMIALEETERASTDWVLMYVSALVDTMVHAPEGDRQRFATEIHDVIVDMGIVTPDVKVLVRTELEQPAAEGDWVLETAETVGDDV
jgi:hypothetical protein